MRVVYVTLALGLFATSVADAAPKGFGCPMATSPSGSRGGLFNRPYLDIRSADIVSGPKYVSAVIRVADTTTSGDPLAALGVRWRVLFKIGNANYLYSLSRDMNGRDTSSSTLAGDGGPAPEVKIDKTSIRWDLPRKEFKALAAPGKVFTEMTASTTFNGGSADSASAVIKYVDREKGCIPQK